MVSVLAPLFEPSISLYAEPCVGMGAVYLDLRARGFKGYALLADTNGAVRSFWEHVHDATKAAVLLAAIRDLEAWPLTSDGHRAMCKEAVDTSSAEYVARFLWITNVSFANNPAIYEKDHWRFEGTKLGGHPGPATWARIQRQTEKVIAGLRGTACTILPDGVPLLAGLPTNASAYVDPPYFDKRQYGSGVLNARTFLDAADACAASLVVLSEAVGEPETEGWEKYSKLVVDRVSQGTGAGGNREEVVFVRRRASR